MSEPNRYAGRSITRRSGGDEPLSVELSELQPAGSSGCVFCGQDSVWQHDLDPSSSRWRDTFGYGMTWGSPLAVCDDCETLWNRSEYWRLSQRQQASGVEGSDRSTGDRLLAVAAFCRSDLGSRRQS